MADAAFIGLSILTVGSALFALESREIIYGAIALAISMLGIAGFFILLDSHFVAMFQIAVYVGAVAVLVIFIVMLVRTEELFSTTDDHGRKVAGVIFSLLMMIGIGVILFSSEFTKVEFNPVIDKIVNKIGNEMLTYYAPVFILLALTLAGSIIGALSLARREDDKENNYDTNDENSNSDKINPEQDSTSSYGENQGFQDKEKSDLKKKSIFGKTSQNASRVMKLGRSKTK
ncbi:MAG: NADH-quinone oxidoreductase subunit J [Nitrososphaeraceae archaeon]|nr:NADH-quinone oxidoreductase subunit J [Nitrososphaeraceae archaeon]